MSNRLSNMQVFKGIGFVVLFIALSWIAVFKSGFIDVSKFKSKPTYDKALVDSVAIMGSIKAKDLNLSGSEIKKMNLAALRNREKFSKVNIHLNRDERYGSMEIKDDTILNMVVELEVAKDCTIQSWDSKFPRAELAPQMTEYIKKAAKEYLHYQKSLDKKAKFKLIL